MIKFNEIKPNDVAQAIAYYRQCMANETWSAEKAESLLMLQDNPDVLIDAIIAASSAEAKP